ncbi:MAG TPA: hypothetical protein VF828_01185 [Patescibacteria group bacterium]
MAKLLASFSFLILFFLLSSRLFINSQDAISDLQIKINQYTQKIDELSKAKDTLKNQIDYLNSQIQLTSLKIQQTESSVNSLQSQISNLTSKISQMDANLDTLTAIYLKEVVANYKIQKRTPSVILFAGSGFNSILSQYKYIASVQKASQKTMEDIETVRTGYDIQKTAKKEKQQQLLVLESNLKVQNDDLANQKHVKDNLLYTTQNNELKYQQLLSQAKAELVAIQDIIAGKGIEELVGPVKSGDKIASIIEGPSCSSGGSHLHFTVRDSGTIQNPFNYLKPVDHDDYSGGDSFNPTGSWDWPMKSKIQFNQGYGKTWSIDHTWVGRIYNFHNGVDISSTSGFDVLATLDGTLYRGSLFIQSQNCTLRYVKVEGKDNHIDTLNLHVNYF